MEIIENHKNHIEGISDKRSHGKSIWHAVETGQRAGSVEVEREHETQTGQKRGLILLSLFRIDVKCDVYLNIPVAVQ
jgi:hypothetical protein